METGDCDVTACTVTHVMNMQYVLRNVEIELSDITKNKLLVLKPYVGLNHVFVYACAPGYMTNTNSAGGATCMHTVF